MSAIRSQASLVHSHKSKCPFVILQGSRLAQLELKATGISDTGAACLASAIASPNSALRALHVDDNEITDEGAVIMATALRSPHCKLVSLDLDNNPVGDIGAYKHLCMPHTKG
jgi:Ran GTPase-activating protein (RanGAP) involved in mRNA processing and transport